MLEGSATAKTLRGKVKKLDVIYTDTYRLAVANGFEGTIDEWLASLKGGPGKDGYTPVRGTDFWTDEDKAEINAYIDNKVDSVILPATVEKRETV